MKGALGLRNLVDTAGLDMSSSNITTGAWVQLVASLAGGCSAVEIFNPSATSMQIAIGASGKEVALKYTIIPGGPTFPVAMELPKGARISLKALDTTANAGRFAMNFLG